MELLNMKIIRALPPLGSTNDDIPLNDRIVICSFYIPHTNKVWYVLEGQPGLGFTWYLDFTFYGYVVDGCISLFSVFTIDGLLKISKSCGNPIKRDTSVFKVPYGELIARNTNH